MHRISAAPSSGWENRAATDGRSARLGRVQARARRGASAPRSAKGARFMSETKTVSVGQIGRSLPRVEARAKVTGRAEYVHNLRLPGMLWAKIARSTVPHGRIRHIDTSAVQATHGVYSVIPSLPARTSSGSSRTRISGLHFTIIGSWRSERDDYLAGR